jgi:hypothetical protein
MPTVQDLTTQLEQAKIDEKASRAAAVEQQAQRDRELHAIELGAAAELRGLSEMAARVFATKATASRPTADVKGLARKFLHQGIEVFEVERLAADRIIGDRLGINSRAAQLLLRFADTGVQDDHLYAELEAIESRAWGLAIERARQLAGEAVDS